MIVAFLELSWATNDVPTIVKAAMLLVELRVIAIERMCGG
jgi:hypothetical protein